MRVGPTGRPKERRRVRITKPQVSGLPNTNEQLTTIAVLHRLPAAARDMLEPGDTIAMSADGEKMPFRWWIRRAGFWQIKTKCVGILVRQGTVKCPKHMTRAQE